MTASREMPKYQCHKQVWALKIKAIGEGSSNSEFAILQFEDAGYGPLPVSADWHFKHKPEAGGYYVVYEDGYKSYSPASAFESGYTSCDVGAIALPVVDPGPDSLERAMESKTYQDGSTAFGPAPLPDVSPALWAKPLGKEVPELTVSLSDLGLEREIQSKANKAPRVTPADIEAEIVSEHYHSPLQAGEHAWTGDANGALNTLTVCVLVLRNGFTVIGHSACASPENFNAEIGCRIARENAVEKVWPLLGFRLRDQLAGA